jgi:hypothetical protein
VKETETYNFGFWPEDCWTLPGGSTLSSNYCQQMGSLDAVSNIQIAGDWISKALSAHSGFTLL